ncbi:hypothetical protein HYH03_001483 [Edaphochlamys debaryana]|uniref:HYR domain-containing protein n=1 Tax=Edaphochlamys debaryana TaxID=47281 RepID=A0A835YDI6_9CHLO|nr:hypothetical protein HYH03_001483 [Edaphochlamys debaryana]|eukprot:KAG2500718.1 hypothetical protein HYH03_001483 [Edaphochlamys debaryana]
MGDGTATVECAPPLGGALPFGANTLACTASDAAGNTAAASFTLDVVDKTPPFIAVSDTAFDVSKPQGVVTYAAPSTWDNKDGAGTARCTPASGGRYGASGDPFAFGPNKVTCTATDAAGNTATQSFTLTVENCAWSGFLPPVNATGATEMTLTPAQTLPIKWSLGGNYGLGIIDTLNGYPKLQNVACSNPKGPAVGSELSLASSLGSALKFDGSTGQYILNYKIGGVVKDLCYRFVLKLKVCPIERRFNIKVR